MKSARELLQVDSEGIVTAPYILVYASGNRRHIRPLGDVDHAEVLCGAQKGLHGDTSIFNESICPHCLRELAKRPKAPEPHRAIIDKSDDDTTEEAEEEGPVKLYTVDLACGRFEAVREDLYTVIYDEDGNVFWQVPGTFLRGSAEFFIPQLKRTYDEGVEAGKRMRSAEIRKLLEIN